MTTKLTPENLIKTCEVAALNAPFKAIMASIGASENLIYHWRTASIRAEKENDTKSIFYFEWRQGCFSFWHNKIRQARIDFIEGYEAELRHECRYGREEIVLGPDQQVVYRLDPELLRVSDDDLLNLYGRTDRYLLDDDGMPVPLTKLIFPAAPIRLRILEQDRRYLATQNLNVNMEAKVVHHPAPLQRRADEPRADIAELRRLALMPPEERRQLIGASAYPKNAATGLVMPAATGTPRGDNRSDHIKEQQPIAPPPNPRMYEAPHNPAPAARPSYAKPNKTLDTGEGIGRGEPAPGGFKVR